MLEAGYFRNPVLAIHAKAHRRIENVARAKIFTSESPGVIKRAGSVGIEAYLPLS